jgi:hypothetical protein
LRKHQLWQEISLKKNSAVVPAEKDHAFIHSRRYRTRSKTIVRLWALLHFTNLIKALFFKHLWTTQPLNSNIRTSKKTTGKSLKTLVANFLKNPSPAKIVNSGNAFFAHPCFSIPVLNKKQAKPKWFRLQVCLISD